MLFPGYRLSQWTYFKFDPRSQARIDLGTFNDKSEIEGEYLSREYVMSSFKNNLGLHTHRHVRDQRASGIARFMTEVYQSINQDLTIDMLFYWLKLLLGHHSKLNAATWRTGLGSLCKLFQEHIVGKPYIVNLHLMVVYRRK